MKKLLLFIALVTLGFISFGQEWKTKTFNNEIEFSFPEVFEIQLRERTTIYHARAFMASITAMDQTLAQGSLASKKALKKKYASVVEEALEKLNGKVLVKKRFKLNKLIGQISTIEFSPQGFPTYIQSASIIIKGKSYTFSVLSRNKENPLFDKLLASLSLKKPLNQIDQIN